MTEPLIVANWKMHTSLAEAKKFFADIKDWASKHQAKAQVVICPPAVWLHQAQSMLQKTRVQWGAQHVHQAKQGAFTGEISLDMLADLDCGYVILGHSERRELFAESNASVAEKYQASLNHEINPILCIGETLDARNANKTFDWLSSQLDPLLDFFTQHPKQVVIAYEPIWAIGTGQTASPEQAEEVHAWIRKKLSKIDAKLAKETRILYGGSVKPGNARSLIEMPNIDGFLVGGASLQLASMTEIVTTCSKYY
jgi:triosephosphate isomerase (TIM)